MAVAYSTGEAMRIYRRKRNDSKTGRKVESGRWYVAWADAFNDLRHTWPAYTDKRASATMGRKLEAISERKASGEQLDADLRDFIDGLPAKRRQELVDLRLIDRAFVQRGDALEEHLDRWIASMTDRTAKHRTTSRKHVERVLQLASIDRLADITTSGLNQAMGKLADAPLNYKPITRQHHRSALYAFLKWAIVQRLIPSVNLDELVAVRKAKAERERAALTIDEQRRLLEAAGAGQPFIERARGGEIRNETDGQTRALVYRLVMETGLRSAEVRALTVADFNLIATQPTLRLQAGVEKNRKGFTFRLRPDTAIMLRDHLSHKAPASAAFNLPDGQNMARMLRADLEAARAAWIAQAGEDFDERQRREKSDTLANTRHNGAVLDFHGLRVTFITNLARAGVPVSLAMFLARHSDPRLTMGIYAKIGNTDTDDALDRLPDYRDDDGGNTAKLKATGTDDDSGFDRVMDRSDAGQGGTDDDAVTSEPADMGDGGDSDAVVMHSARLELATCGSVSRKAATAIGPHDAENADSGDAGENWTAPWTVLRDDHPALHGMICDLIRTWPALTDAQREALLQSLHPDPEAPR